VKESKELKEDEIRPQRFNEGKKLAAAEDIEYLKRHLDEFVSVDCPACNNSNHHLELVKETFRYLCCEKCHTVYMSPRPNRRLLGEFYKQSKLYAYWNDYIFPSSEVSRRNMIFKPRVDRVVEISQKYLTVFEHFLEVGSGYGTFSEELKSRKLFGSIDSLELTPNLAETCRRKGLNVIERAIEGVDIDDYYDAIGSFETLEHLYSPREFVISCFKMLRPNGILFMSMPNYFGYDIQVLGEQSSSIDHEHINLFNPNSVSQLVVENGFEVLELFTPGELDVDIIRNKVIAGEMEISDKFTRQVVLSKSKKLRQEFQQFLSQNLLSSHMWIVARKY
jgi:2-polyprenyl-3-methyl-5-hydroxy-6-metoxy-1,4-benzoquinol methylase